MRKAINILWDYDEDEFGGTAQWLGLPDHVEIPSEIEDITDYLSTKYNFPVYDFIVIDEDITVEMASGFWRDLMGTLWHDPYTKTTHGIMGDYLVADHMRITTDKAKAFLDACIRYGITERQGGAYVV